MRMLLLIILSFCGSKAFCQKQPLDSFAYKEWPSLGIPVISNNGEYVMYKVENLPVGSHTLFLKSTHGNWEKKIVGQSIAELKFTMDSKSLLFSKGKDSLGLYVLGSDIVKYISGVTSSSSKLCGDKEWLYFYSSKRSKNLILKEIKSGRERSYQNVVNYFFSDDGRVLILEQELQGKADNYQLNWVNMTNGKSHVISNGTKQQNLVIDEENDQIVFKRKESIWHYKLGMLEAICVYSNKNEPALGLFNFGNISHFSKDGNRIFISLNEKCKPLKKEEIAEIWSYQDLVLQSQQNVYPEGETYLGVIDLISRKVIRLQKNITEFYIFPSSKNASDTIALVGNQVNLGEPWHVSSKTSWCLESTKTGKRILLPFLNEVMNVDISAAGKYLLYFDSKKQNYLSYNIADGTIRRLTDNLGVQWIDRNRDDLVFKSPRNFNELVWLDNDDAVLVYDRYDLWKIDPSNHRDPVNITNGYGKNHKIIFDLGLPSYSQNGVKNTDQLYLSAFNENDKSNGFYYKELNKVGNPKLLSMGPYIYNTSSGYVPDGANFIPIKAKNSDSYIVQRMGVNEAPNYFYTNDFKSFNSLSNLHPQEKYNWYTTELHKWKSLDGRILHGVLYKPKDFDPNKHYPVIFNPYERKSDGLNAFVKPEPLCGGCNIDIPTYVSYGYLVFCPDIYYNIGDPMQGTYDAVISAANYLSNLSYVNADKFGIQGCSFGGIQTNYLVTHSQLFAAAVSSSGMSDFVSGYGSVAGGRSQSSLFETGQVRMGVNLWEKPDMYIKNSPIFSTGRVTTPILIMHTKNDGICLYPNILEFFIGLRRLGKKTWMLAYSEGNHGLHGEEANDFSIKMMQFFDHYLMDMPAPIWMKRSNMSEISKDESVIEHDNEIKTPGIGILKPLEQKKVDSLLTRKPLTLLLR